jgi:hypothetical protein
VAVDGIDLTAPLLTLTKDENLMATQTAVGGPFIAAANIVNNMEVFQSFADNATVGTSFETIANGDVDLVLPPVAGEDLDIVSADANDEGIVGGTGARTVKIRYIDANGNIGEQIVALNGTTPVELTEQNIQFVLSAHVETSGTGLAAAGAITIAAVTGGAVFGIIDAGSATLKNNTFYVPADSKGYLYGFWADMDAVAAGAGTAEVALQVAEKATSGVRNSETWQTVAKLTKVEGDNDIVAATGGNVSPNGAFEFPGGVPYVVPAGAMVRLAGKAGSGTVAITAGMSMLVSGINAGTVTTES